MAFDPFNSRKAILPYTTINALTDMGKIQIKALAPALAQEIVVILMYQGKLQAIKRYWEQTGCDLQEAKKAIERLALEIAPGQA